MDQETWRRGMEMRKRVLGTAHVDAAHGGADAFTRPFQDLATEVAWGAVWSRAGLDLRARSILTLGMLCATGRFADLPMHIRGALANGVTEEELREILLQMAIYCGFPAASEAFRIARDVLAERPRPTEG